MGHPAQSLSGSLPEGWRRDHVLEHTFSVVYRGR